MEEVEATGGEAVRALEVRDVKGDEALYAGWGATTFFERLRGLMLRRPFRPGQCLFIAPCRSVHTLFMMFPIDILYIAEDGTVLAIDGPGVWGGFTRTPEACWRYQRGVVRYCLAPRLKSGIDCQIPL